MYKLDFTDDEQGRERFEICYQAIVMTNKDVTRENEDDFIHTLKKLKSISLESRDDQGKKIKLGGIVLRDLQDGGGTIELERSEHSLLLDCIKRPIWRPIVLEQKKECENWIAGMLVDKKPNKKDKGDVAGTIGEKVSVGE